MKKMMFWGTAVALSLSAFAQTQSFDLDVIIKKKTFGMKFAPGFDVRADGVSYSVQESGENNTWKITRYDLETGKAIGTIFNSEKLSEQFAPESYTFSADESHLLITAATERIYRHSSKSKAYVININTGQMTVLPGKVMYPTLSPNNSHVAYVRDNNLYYYDLATQKETAITSDGKQNQIINGAVDWVYEPQRLEVDFYSISSWEQFSSKFLYKSYS